MTAHIDEAALRSSLQRLREAASEADVVAVMKRTVNSVQGVFGYGGAGIMFGLVLAVFFAWSREKRADGGLGWLESARRSNFATLVSAHQDANAPGESPSPAPATARAVERESVDDDEHLAAYNAFLARINKPQDR